MGQHTSKVATPVEPFRFLDLPLSIRNEVYGYCREPGYVTMESRPHDQANPNGRQGYRWRCQTGALVQVCQQIRSEFLPIYREHTQVYLKIEHMSRFCEAIYPAIFDQPSGVTVNPATYRGRLLVDLGSPMDPIDILPLVRLSFKAPLIAIRLNSFTITNKTSKNTKSDLQSMLAMNGNTSKLHDLLDNIQALLFSGSRDTPEHLDYRYPDDSHRLEIVYKDQFWTTQQEEEKEEIDFDFKQFKGRMLLQRGETTNTLSVSRLKNWWY